MIGCVVAAVVASFLACAPPQDSREGASRPSEGATGAVVSLTLGSGDSRPVHRTALRVEGEVFLAVWAETRPTAPDLLLAIRGPNGAVVHFDDDGAGAGAPCLGVRFAAPFEGTLELITKSGPTEATLHRRFRPRSTEGAKLAERLRSAADPTKTLGAIVSYPAWSEDPELLELVSDAVRAGASGPQKDRIAAARRAFEGTRSLFPPDHLRVAKARGRLVLELCLGGEMTEALALAEQGVVAAAPHRDSDPLRCSEAHAVKAGALSIVGRHLEAARHFERAEQALTQSASVGRFTKAAWHMAVYAGSHWRRARKPKEALAAFARAEAATASIPDLKPSEMFELRAGAALAIGDAGDEERSRTFVLRLLAEADANPACDESGSVRHFLIDLVERARVAGDDLTAAKMAARCRRMPCDDDPKNWEIRDFATGYEVIALMNGGEIEAALNLAEDWTAAREGRIPPPSLVSDVSILSFGASSALQLGDYPTARRFAEAVLARVPTRGAPSELRPMRLGANLVRDLCVRLTTGAASAPAPAPDSSSTTSRR
jgi:hypothetical protein